MQSISNIKSVHIELTDKCQAQCPMCARNFHGGITRTFIKNNDISIDNFKQWFPQKFLAQLTNFYSCGNYGDPAFAKDCLEIFSYVRESNPTTRLAIHTNGGMRNKEWWAKFANAIGTVANSEVIFAVDGFKGKHELYRKNTKFDKVIENLKSFIDAGGTARVDSLVFEHNEDEVDELEKYLLELGVVEVNFVSTARFYEMTEFAVLDNNGNVEYKIKPAKTPRFKQTTNYELNKLVDKDFREKVIEKSQINPRCVSDQGIYVDPRGDIFPCCWIGGEFVEQPINESLPIHYLRNLSVQVTKDMLNIINVPNCDSGILNTDGVLFGSLEDFWEGKNKCLTCIRQCSKTIYNKHKND